MIIEYFGLPCSGKTTFINSLSSYLQSSNIDHVVVKTERIFNPYNRNGKYFTIRLIFKIILNFIKSPALSYVIFISLIKQDECNIIKKNRIIISLQYHLFWINKRLNLSKKKDGVIYLLDGSPWNILSEFNNYDYEGWHSRLCKLYIETNRNDLIVFSVVDPKLCFKYMMSRHSQQTEKFLYGSISKFDLINENFHKIVELIPFNNLIETNLHIEDPKIFFDLYIKNNL